MKRLMLTIMGIVAASATGLAHFVFVVPAGEGVTAQVLLSETLQRDAQVDVNLIAGTTLSLRSPDAKDTPLALAAGDHAFTVALPGGARGVIHGLADLGLMKSAGSGPSYVLLYHSKTIVGDAFGPGARLPASEPVEIVPTGAAGAVRLLFLARSKPQP